MESSSQDREFEFTPKDFGFLRSLIKDKAGIILADHKQPMVYSRVSRRLRELNLRRCQDYIALLQQEGSDAEVLNLLNIMTTNLTHFFRENHHFDFLLKQFTAQGRFVKDSKIRLWSAGCSSGMEAYSMAMTLHPHLSDFSRKDCKILATDIDTNILQRGRAAHYRASDIEGIETNYKKYFESKPDGGVQVKESIRNFVTFNPLNLMDKTWPCRGPFQLIFCRNVMIYFDKETQNILVNKFSKLLVDGGYLIVGHSENISGMCPQLSLIGRNIYEKK